MLKIEKLYGLKTQKDFHLDPGPELSDLFGLNSKGRSTASGLNANPNVNIPNSPGNFGSIEYGKGGGSEGNR